MTAAVPPTDPANAGAPAAPPAPANGDRLFLRVLVNTLIANVTTSYLWFALTFWVYLETKSVMATAIIGGAYMLFVALLGTWFGTLVDRYRKRPVMIASSLITLATYAVAGVLFLLLPTAALLNWRGPWFWLFAGIILLGGVVENLRNIALSTTVTILVPVERRDKANGLVGTVQGIAFMVTSVLSGLSIGFIGMSGTLLVALIMTAVATAHLLLAVRIPEPRHAAGADPWVPRGIDFRGAWAAVRSVPGLLALLLFATFNNLVGGVFMALMDPYGLTLFDVKTWGIVLGVTSIGFIVGGGLVAKLGLGPKPLRTLLLVNIALALLGATFTLREFWWLYAAGIFGYMALIPAAEAAEQTIIQRVVPLSTQGRVFGLAASIESAAAPVSAFIIGPIAEFMVLPALREPGTAASYAWLLGRGEARGIALVFLAASLVLLVVVLLAFASRSYRRLSAAYAEAEPATVEAVEGAADGAGEGAADGAGEGAADGAADGSERGASDPLGGSPAETSEATSGETDATPSR
ncbi:MFS transporter [Galactobacter valiniphilus]|uniref:MFS transporter n=1 Tax=Galactobacter valiniphilus TaxID=2676122 RepID=UPI003734CCFE